MKLFEKINETKSRLQKATLKKSGLNKFQNYSYFELADFLPEIIKAEQELKFCNIITFSKVDDETFINLVIQDENEKIQITSPIANADVKGVSPIQSLGAQHTYLRRYLYVMAYEISEHDAIDGINQEVKKADNRASSVKKESAKGSKHSYLISEIYDIVKQDESLKSIVDGCKQDFKVESIKECTENQLQVIFDSINLG